MVISQELLGLASRRRIYDALVGAPGLHFRQLERTLSMAKGTLEYHLRQMERAELLVTREDGRYKAYYPNADLDRRDRDVLYWLRQAMPRRIALEVAHEPGLTFQELAQRLPISKSTLSFHVHKLVGAGVLGGQPAGRSVAYDCTDPERIKRLVLRYRSSFVDDVVDRFAEAWLDLGVGGA